MRGRLHPAPPPARPLRLGLRGTDNRGRPCLRATDPGGDRTAIHSPQPGAQPLAQDGHLPRTGHLQGHPAPQDRTLRPGKSAGQRRRSGRVAKRPATTAAPRHTKKAPRIIWTLFFCAAIGTGRTSSGTDPPPLPGGPGLTASGPSRGKRQDLRAHPSATRNDGRHIIRPMIGAFFFARPLRSCADPLPWLPAGRPRRQPRAGSWARSSPPGPNSAG